MRHLIHTVFAFFTFISFINAQPPATSEEEEEEEVAEIDTKYFFIGHIGGNIDFSERRLGLSSVYTDMQFNPQLIINEKFGIRLPIRIYYNNDIGPVLSDSSNRQRFITVDTVTAAPKVRYWDDQAALVNKSETRNLGLNIPVLLTYRLGNNPNWSVVGGINLDFVWVTNRNYDFRYSPLTIDSTKGRVVNTFSQVPTVPVRVITAQGSSVTATSLPFYGTTPLRPGLPPDRAYGFAQIFAGFQVGLEHQSNAFNFSLRYSLGGTSSYAERRYNQMNSYNHVFQLIFLEKKVGLQFFGEVRAANVSRDERTGSLTAPTPRYYFSLSKTIYLSKIKEIFFP